MGDMEELRRKWAEIKASEEETAALIQRLERVFRSLQEELEHNQAMAQEAMAGQTAYYLDRLEAAARQMASLKDRLLRLHKEAERFRYMREDLERRIPGLSGKGRRVLRLEA